MVVVLLIIINSQFFGFYRVWLIVHNDGINYRSIDDSLGDLEHGRAFSRKRARPLLGVRVGLLMSFVSSITLQIPAGRCSRFDGLSRETLPDSVEICLVFASWLLSFLAFATFLGKSLAPALA